MIRHTHTPASNPTPSSTLQAPKSKIDLFRERQTEIEEVKNRRLNAKLDQENQRMTASLYRFVAFMR